MSKDIVANVPGTIPQPIPKKFVKKASGGQNLAKEEVAGFADASAPSNSNYQTELSPTQTAKSKKMPKKTVKEAYYRRMVELAHVCPKCNNTGMMHRFGQNMLCDAPSCSAGEDKRTEKENEMYVQARDMLSTGKTTAVAEDVISSLDDVEPVLEAYKASDKLLSRTRHLVQPKLSKTLRDRLDARRASNTKKSKGYTPSQGTLGLARARKAMMSHSKEKSPKGYPEETKSLAHGEVADDMAHKKPVPRKVNEEPVLPEVPGLKGKMKKPNLSAQTPGKLLPALSAKPMMGSSNDNRVSESWKNFKQQNPANGNNDPVKNRAKLDSEALEKKKAIEKKALKKEAVELLADGKKETKSNPNIKKRYLGAMRGRTATGKPAHAIEMDPVVNTNSDINKVVK
jgi:hypothetical protein